MATHYVDNDTVAGTVGGTILSVVPNLQAADVLSTLVLAALGAVTSFLVTQLLKWLVKRIKK